MGERKSKKWWVLDNRELPAEVLGYECPPNDDFWWFPSLGFSCEPYPNREAAVAASRKKLEGMRDRALEALRLLDAELAGDHQKEGR